MNHFKRASEDALFFCLNSPNNQIAAPLFLIKSSELMDQNRMKAWLKRIGVAGFLFFFLKGLVWIAIFIGVGKCAM